VLVGAKSAGKSRTYPGGCVHSEHAFWFIKGKEASLTDFILAEIFGIFSIRDGSIYASETFRKYHNVSLRVGEN
jgi:hypothetical protein